MYRCQLKRLKSQYFVPISLNRLLFVYNFAVISNGMLNITVNYSDCHLPAEILEACLFANKLDRCSVNLVVTRQTLKNKY